MEKPKIQEWIDCNIELPPSDGVYLVTNHPNDTYDLGVCQYDGIGFSSIGIYKNPKYWAYQKPLQKKYGKIKDF